MEDRRETQSMGKQDTATERPQCRGSNGCDSQPHIPTYVCLCQLLVTFLAIRTFSDVEAAGRQAQRCGWMAGAGFAVAVVASPWHLQRQAPASCAGRSSSCAGLASSSLDISTSFA